MPERFVELLRSADPLQQALLDDVLREAGIPCESVEGHGPSAFFGSANPIVDVIFRVPEDRLQEAKDVLCANGIVCDVSERLLRRTFEEVVRPLLENPGLDPGRLVYLIGINNKETVRALFEVTLKEEGGRRLLEDLFFLLAAENLPALRALARALGDRTSQEFADRFFVEIGSAPKPTRLGLLESLSELSYSFPRERALLGALRDEDPEIRDAAGEALYAIRQVDYGYAPEAPEAEREAAIERFRRAVRLA